MTSDLEATTDDLFNTIRALWLEASGGTGDDLPAGGFGQRVTSVADEAIASASGMELAAIREYLDHADGTKLVVERDGEQRKVVGLL